MSLCKLESSSSTKYYEVRSTLLAIQQHYVRHDYHPTVFLRARETARHHFLLLSRPVWRMSKPPALFQDHNFYEILNLKSPQPGTYPSTEDIKQAYRRALLHHHPDKSSAGEDQRRRNDKITSMQSIDDIILAYKTLSNASARAEYDRSLRDGGVLHHSPLKDKLRSSHETVDLDEMVFDAELNVWYRSCRCGDERGFMVTEAELEEAAEAGAVMMGCKGCSLWLQVEFEAVNESIHEGGEKLPSVPSVP